MASNFFQMMATKNFSQLNQTLYIVDENMINLADNSYRINFMLILIGIIDNSICIYVFLQRKMIKIKFNWYLLVLAIFELLFCFILFIDYSFRLIYQKPMFLHDFNVFANIIIDYILHLIDSYVTLVTMILSIDRIQAIKNPTEIKKLITYTQSKRLIVVTLTILILLKLPGIILCYENTNLRVNILYCTFVTPMVFNIVPTVIVLALNSFLVFKITNYYRIRDRLASIHSSIKSHEKLELNRKQTAKLINYSRKLPISCLAQKPYYVMIVLAVWLILTTTPYYTLNMFYLLFQMNVLTNHFNFEKVMKMQVISSVFFNSNHCLNFFIYFFFNFEFRRYIFKIFKRLCFCF
jgi:hypothetical protein